ncbi:MAG: rhodanese-related sulfurtransferase [Pegethrix bostrychoides GSE-TBD4-15B]|jgi:UPF0176 protein|uniref:tRNA uridine(34) hydroxylase n=1 Tax=Pegethrix bostrychoides GSE-TBD4-15B TaxID=2839662 RepID=A0A951PFM1_9CYAN|nr:rhodanese-related sulfurtransferase [Pegethrix bostrychoides GSE-TBD4-15B]
MTFTVATFYKFVPLPDSAEVQPRLLEFCQTQSLRGTVLLAVEGINGTVAGTDLAVESLLSYLRSDSRLADLSAKFSTAEQMPFERLKVRLKREIVTLGIPIDPNQVGQYVEPTAWNALIADPDLLLIDTRNQYEVAIGSFEGAENPGTDAFREFPDYVQQRLNPAQHKKIAMFCTGGIRCEKASAYLLSQGFEQVYHLKGGILSYLEQVPAAESRWRGECFLFDQRVAVQQGLEPGTHELCLGCGHPLSEANQQAPEYEAGVSCPHCFDRLSKAKRQRQIAKMQGKIQGKMQGKMQADLRL